MRQAAEFGELRDQLAFLINNYDLLLTLWGDRPPPGTEDISRRVKVWKGGEGEVMRAVWEEIEREGEKEMRVCLC